jgi:hypothetical protein
MHGFRAIGEHCKTVRRNMDSEMEEEFLACMIGISFNLKRLFHTKTQEVYYIFPHKRQENV